MATLVKVVREDQVSNGAARRGSARLGGVRYG